MMAEGKTPRQRRAIQLQRAKVLDGLSKVMHGFVFTNEKTSAYFKEKGWLSWLGM